MKYQKIGKIEFVETGKLWVKVTFENGSEWFPDLIGMGEILSMIAHCEDVKYPRGEGGEYMRRFIDMCINSRASHDTIISFYDNMFDPQGIRLAKNGGPNVPKTV